MHADPTLRAPQHGDRLFQRGMHHRAEGGALHLDRAEADHQPLKQSLLLVLIIVMNASATGMSPDLGRDEEESQTRDGQCGVLQFRRIGHRFSGKQHQPCIEVEGDHGELKMNAIHVEPA